jgi:hypothetical protein
MNSLDFGNSISLTASEEAFQNYVHLFYFLIVERNFFASSLIDDEISKWSFSFYFILSACLQGFLNTGDLGCCTTGFDGIFSWLRWFRRSFNFLDLRLNFSKGGSIIQLVLDTLVHSP